MEDSSNQELNKEEQELNELYPPGSPARRVLDYSRATHASEVIHPLLVTAFKLLMGISIVMALSAAVAFFLH